MAFEKRAVNFKEIMFKNSKKYYVSKVTMIN